MRIIMQTLRYILSWFSYPPDGRGEHLTIGHRDPSWKKKDYYKEEFSCPHCGDIVRRVTGGEDTGSRTFNMNFYCSSCDKYIRSEDIHWKKVPVA